MSMDKNRAIDTAVAQIERAFGKGSIMRLGGSQVVEVETISTGSLGLDIALGVGGLPRGRVVEVYGQARRRWPSRLSPRPRRRVASAVSSMRSMPLIQPMRESWGSTSMIS
jgi:hypothetical protein